MEPDMSDNQENPFELPHRDLLTMHQQCAKCGSTKWNFGFSQDSILIFCIGCENGLRITVEDGKFGFYSIHTTGKTKFNLS